jgi:hypothetical protein
MTLQNLRAFEITFIQVTNNRGARVKIKDMRHVKTKIIPFDYEYNNIKDMALKYLESKGIKCLYSCESNKGYILLSDNFEVQIK